jgi:predicted metal-dependent phosphoesterase TrpH
MKVDLHIHSDFSDGKYSPEQIVRFATEHGLGIIALTDHDTIDGLDEISAAAQKLKKVRVIPGVELSVWLGEHELHILGYGIKATVPELVRLVEIAQVNRRNRISRILETLQANHVNLPIEDVKNGFRAISLGRLHVAHALLARGYVYTIREAFERYLSYDTGVITLKPLDFIKASDAVQTILKAGGIPVLAHPSIEQLDLYIDVLKDYGLQGVEVYKGSRTSIEEFYFETVVNDKGLLLTGGSDWHGHSATRRLGTFSVDSKRIQPFLEAIQVS